MISTPGRICLRGRVHATYKKHIFGILCTSLSSLFVFPQPARYCRRNHYLRSFGSFGERAGGEGGRRTKEERTGTSINLRSGGRGGAPRPQTCRVVGENVVRERERESARRRPRARVQSVDQRAAHRTRRCAWCVSCVQVGEDLES